MNEKTKDILLISSIAVASVGVLYGAWHFRNRLLYSMIDNNNREKLNELHPKYKNAFANFLTDLKLKGYVPLVTSGYRSIAKQQELHNQNPSAAIAGHSLHNFGLATDINIMKPSFIGMNQSNEKWKPIVEIANKNGLDWGGNLFPSYSSGGGDRVHFQPKTMTLSGTKLLAMYNDKKVDKNGYVKI